MYDLEVIMTTMWFPTPTQAGRGRLRGAAMTGLTIDGPRTVRRRRRPAPPVRTTQPATQADARRSHEFQLQATR